MTNGIGVPWGLVSDTDSQAPPSLLNQNQHINEIPGDQRRVTVWAVLVWRTPTP